jgi:hypothetical protein
VHDQQISSALRERADACAPAPPSLDAIRAAVEAPGSALGQRGRSRRLALVAAALVLVGAGAAGWVLGGRDAGSAVRTSTPAPDADPTAVDVPAPTVPAPTGPETGWYLPGDLPGWTVDQAVAQAADGKGEAQLWLTGPTGARVILSLKVPHDGPSHPTDAELHPLRGTTRSAYLKTFQVGGAGQGGPAGWEAVLWADWPGATLIATSVPPPDDALTEQEAIDLLDAVVSALRPTATASWRAFLGTVGSADPALIEAETLDDLPDACC